MCEGAETQRHGERTGVEGKVKGGRGGEEEEGFVMGERQ